MCVHGAHTKAATVSARPHTLSGGRRAGAPHIQRYRLCTRVRALTCSRWNVGCARTQTFWGGQARVLHRYATTSLVLEGVRHLFLCNRSIGMVFLLRIDFMSRHLPLHPLRRSGPARSSAAASSACTTRAPQSASACRCLPRRRPSWIESRARNDLPFGVHLRRFCASTRCRRRSA